jgi:hypothetical protein
MTMPATLHNPPIFVPTRHHGSDALPVVSPANIEMVCLGTATSVDDCSRGLVISLYVGGDDVGAGRYREDCRLVAYGPRDDDEESSQGITQDWIS